jgi:hypothetical protein|tara:strand:- start:650 stop:1024 length:375 start_codon:yes stop_codon:yes gene_type:complete
MTGYKSKRAAAQEQMNNYGNPVSKYEAQMNNYGNRMSKFEEQMRGAEQLDIAYADCVIAVAEWVKEALAQPAQEPVGFVDSKLNPIQRPWIGLTDEEMQALWDRYAHMEMMRAIEAKLKEKNNG